LLGAALGGLIRLAVPGPQGEPGKRRLRDGPGAGLRRWLPGLQAELLAPGVVEVGGGGAARPGGLVVFGGEVARAGAGEEGLAARPSGGGGLLAVKASQDIPDVGPSLLAGDLTD